MIGRVIKGIGGFYFVHDGKTAVMGKARGSLKRNKELIYVGDIVDFDIDENDCDNECVINRVVERRNYMTRPPVSNLDMLVVVFSLKDPQVNYPVVDKLLAGCELKGIDPVICITKRDLVSEDELREAAAIYERIYPVACVNGLILKQRQTMKKDRSDRQRAEVFTARPAEAVIQPDTSRFLRLMTVHICTIHRASHLSICRRWRQ